MFSRLFQCNTVRLSTRGFTLLEVMVTVAIIAIITALIVLKYGSFNNAVLLKSQAYEIALDIREAQVDAVSARGVAGQFREDYGIFFSLGAVWGGQYQVFLDNGTSLPYYNAGLNEAVGQPTKIDSRFSITSMCINSCATNVNAISITFKRPDFDAQIVYWNGSSLVQANDVELTLTGKSGSTDSRRIYVGPAGQITVN